MRSIFKGKFRVTSGFRLPERSDHNGIDLVGETDKTVLCPIDGIVKTSTIITDRTDLTWEWGNYVRVDDLEGNRLYFCHLDSRLVIAGQKVKVGDPLGIMGNTGHSFGAHTHFEVRKADGKTVLDPAAYLGILNKIGSYDNAVQTAAPTADGWRKEQGKWYWMKAGAYVKSDWVQYENGWYWMQADGSAAIGWLDVKGKTYYFANDTFAQSSGGRVKECQALQIS